MTAILQNFPLPDQGPLFWVSLAALAAGGGLLVGVIAHQVRRLVLRRRSRSAGLAGSTIARALAAYAGPMARPKAVDGARAVAAAGNGAETANHAEPEAPRGGRLDDLLTRLHLAADRLEALSGDPRRADENSPESLLKQAEDEVEYVFRASTL